MSNIIYTVTLSIYRSIITNLYLVDEFKNNVFGIVVFLFVCVCEQWGSSFWLQFNFHVCLGNLTPYPQHRSLPQPTRTAHHTHPCSCVCTVCVDTYTCMFFPCGFASVYMYTLTCTYSVLAKALSQIPKQYYLLSYQSYSYTGCAAEQKSKHTVKQSESLGKTSSGHTSHKTDLKKRNKTHSGSQVRTVSPPTTMRWSLGLICDLCFSINCFFFKVKDKEKIQPCFVIQVQLLTDAFPAKLEVSC